MRNDTTSTKVGLVIPTLNAGVRWTECLEALRQQSVRFHRRLVVDSGSVDQTIELAKAAGFEVMHIEPSTFNHGGTRQRAADVIVECDIVVFLTQDAIPAASLSLQRIVDCFQDPNVAVAYGRQLPHRGATAIEAHARTYSYGLRSNKKDFLLIPQLGSKVFFCSNSFAAYRRSVLSELGGFNSSLILGEDMEFAARAVKAGYANLYCAEATVYHSHSYSFSQTFSRYFDLGVFEVENLWMRKYFGSHNGEGLKFVKSELAYLATFAPVQIPRALSLITAKLVGYWLGKLERFLPRFFKRKISMFPRYFY